MTAPEDEQRIPRGLRIYFGLILCFLAAFVLTAPWRIGGRDIGRLSVALWAALDLAALALLMPRWRQALSRIFREREFGFSRRAVLLAGAAVALFLGRVVFARYAALDINAWDTSLYFDGPIAETLAGRPLFCTYTGRSYLAIHGSYLLFAFVPLYAIAASPVWLLAAQAAAMAAATTAAFLFFRRVFGDDLAAAFFAAALLLNSYTAKTVQYAFHVEVFYPLALFLLLYSHTARRPLLLVCAVLLAVSIKEDAILPLAGFALTAVLFDRRRWQPAAFALVAGLGAFFVGTRIVLPHFSGSAAGHPWYSIYWSAYGQTPLTAAVGMIRHPAQVANDLAHSGLRHLLEPLMLLPLAGLRWLAAALFVLLPYSVASNPQLARFGVYYSAPALAFLFAAAAEGLGRLTAVRSAGLPKEQLRLRRRLGALLLLVLCALDGSGYRFLRSDPARTEIGATVAALGGRRVGVQGSLLLRAGRAPGIRVLQPDRAPDPDESILLAPDTNPYPYAREELDTLISRLSADPRYRRTETPGGLLLFTPALP